MATLVLKPDELQVRLSAWERLGTFQRDFAIPWDLIDSARVIKDMWRNILGWRWPGLGVPHVVLIGRTVYRDGRDFCAIYMDRPGVILELHGAPYRRLLISTPNDVASAIIRRVTQG
ncbi:MAG: hypothetical protein FJW80_01005 [Actinobacteria bacterium]|nr:hypothetical protein [Actinomycetota bacterium]